MRETSAISHAEGIPYLGEHVPDRCGEGDICTEANELSRPLSHV